MSEADEFDAVRLLSGDELYAKELVKRHASLVWTVCESFSHGAMDTEDLVQEVWRAVLQGASSFRRDGSFRAWLYQVARNTCLTRRRLDQGREVRLEAARREWLLRRRAQMADLDREAELGQLRERLAKALRRLPEMQRQTVVLRALEGFTTGEASEAMGVAPATVRSNLRHGLNHLRRLMKDPASDLSRHRSSS